ncbi:unnamed protein product [Brachionus calyciflorus]|uniref:Isochorismatase domain-containing protein 1 n=1 Tax=Brachionus calyciflorus TaxID=104777 RepID=A0A813LXN3_9BILA|nr:unnamed protein product [Brachionus calyciflorus]
MSTIVSMNYLDLSSTAFFLCDMQEKFRPAILYFNEIAEIAQRLVTATNLLNIPLVVTEQYPKGLGPTISSLNIDHAALKQEKTRFSMFSLEVENLLVQNSIKKVVLFGVEAHVCVLQTAIDLLNNGYGVHVVADASSSRSLTDKLYAFDRLRQAGCIVTTHESVLMQLVNDKNHEKFKEIQKLILPLAPNTGLLA